MPRLAFVVTNHATSVEDLDYFDRSMRALTAQTDPDWIAVIVDDASPLPASEHMLKGWARREPDRVFIEWNLASGGAGAARNLGIRRAAALGAESILHCDSDDLSHPGRVARTRALFCARPEIDFVYTGFHPIDVQDVPIPLADMRVDMLDIHEALADHPPQGDDIFAPMAAETGCLIVPSMAAMRTELALRHPFPGGFASEDNHAWMRMAADGAYFAHLPDTSLGYRIVQGGPTELGVNGRDRRFLLEKARNDIDGFECGVRIAVSRGVLAPDDLVPLAARFLERLAACVARNGAKDLAARLRAPSFLDAMVARLPRSEMPPAQPEISLVPVSPATLLRRSKAG